jgi:two-component system LytT family sensor kinase
MNNKISKYWMLQIAGWGLLFLIHLFFAFTFDRLNGLFLGRLTVFVSMGILFSHLMRLIIIRRNILGNPLQRQLIEIFAITLVFALLAGSVETLLTTIIGLKNKQEMRSSVLSVVVMNALTSFVYFFMWNSIYLIYHYIEKSRNQQFDTLKLEALVKELELKTIKSHINPHFIFNALNSIRALIDENPQRARNAITELSNILRSSMQAEKHETVLLERELSIVKDYLALEHIRFEDRLKVELEIEPATLSLPVPPMMLQTLVENAIKHGISRQVAGGTVRIISSVLGGYHQLTVLNTGRLKVNTPESGFGLPGTRSRLYLMFGDKAAFTIRELKGDDKAGYMVEATIKIPVDPVVEADIKRRLKPGVAESGQSAR